MLPQWLLVNMSGALSGASTRTPLLCELTVCWHHHWDSSMLGMFGGSVPNSTTFHALSLQAPILDVSSRRSRASKLAISHLTECNQCIQVFAQRYLTVWSLSLHHVIFSELPSWAHRGVEGCAGESCFSNVVCILDTWVESSWIIVANFWGPSVRNWNMVHLRRKCAGASTERTHGGTQTRMSKNSMTYTVTTKMRAESCRCDSMLSYLSMSQYHKHRTGVTTERDSCAKKCQARFGLNLKGQDKPKHVNVIIFAGPRRSILTWFEMQCYGIWNAYQCLPAMGLKIFKVHTSLRQ